MDVCELIDLTAINRLDEYVKLLAKWRKVTNLIAEDSFTAIWERHILDAVYLQRQRPMAKSWLDFGSGAGLPAAIIAILIADVPESQVHCVEVDRRKCSFLREVASKLAIPLKVHNALAENFDNSIAHPFDVVTARAFSSIERILKVAHPFLREGTVAILPRGRHARDEVARLDDDIYRIDVTANPCPGDGVFVRLELRAPHSL